MNLIRTSVVFLLSLLCFSLACRPIQEIRLDNRLDRIDAVVEEEIEKGNFPGAVVLVGRQDKIVYWKAFGYKIVEPNEEPMDKDTVFDLASLTKPVATATSIMMLVDQQKLNLDDYVSKYLPAFACNGKEHVHIRHLLTHTSGLPAYTNAKELEDEFGDPCPDKVVEKICNLDALNEPGEKFRYSCLGYITLAKIVEIVSGKSVDDFSKVNIYGPLGMKHTAYNPSASWERDIAATEILDGSPLRGKVHDPLARLMAGCSGNAGLFSNAYDLSIYCRMLLNEGVWNGKRILSRRAVTLLTTEQAHGRAYGFDVNSAYSWVKGSHAPKEAFCHTGYTGTSIVCDPVSKTFVIILANRVHPKDDGTTKPVRVNVADIVFSTPQGVP